SNKYDYYLKLYKNKIYSYCIMFLKNKMDADDVAQQVFIRIWENLDIINLLSAKTWIMKTTHRLCIDFARKRNLTMKRELTFENEETLLTENKYLSPVQNIQSKELGEMIKNKIDLLPENLKSVFVLSEIQGLKYKEVSKVLEIPLNSVKVYLLRARKQLQEKLKGVKINETY
ncbi:MAG: RNA polymerase sigma factor, partial [Ignavibacteriales bacterium]|nr:RNA polymerase sigma factor [Ignavibacteriales bacterium]